MNDDDAQCMFDAGYEAGWHDGFGAGLFAGVVAAGLLALIAIWWGLS